MNELQKEYAQFVKEMDFDQFDKKDYRGHREFLLYTHMLLTTEVAEVAEEFRTLFKRTDEHMREGVNSQLAFALAKEEVRENLGKELADCLAYLCKLANYFQV